jgi:hypothetical protein
MNHLAVAGEGEWHLPQHAQINVYEAGGDELLTIYDCGAAQKPPSAQFTGHLVRVEADHETVYQPTGYIVRLRERARLERQAADHWVVRPDGGE